MPQVKKIALLAVGDDAWQGGIQYILNIINALNQVAGKPLSSDSLASESLEVHLFRHAAQNFPDLETFTNIRLVVQNTEEHFLPFSFSNRIKWFAQRKFMGRINPRLENLFLQQQFDYVFPSTLSDCNGRLNSGAWIADFQYHHFPGGASPAVIRAARNVIGAIAERAKKVILSSKYCENDCLELFPVSKGKTHVMPFAVYLNRNIFSFTDFDSIREKYSLPQRFLVVANLFAPTKNHKTLFNALGILKSRGIEVNLVCTGNIVDYRNEGFANEILQMLTSNKIRNQVHLLGLIPRAHQVALFRMSVAMAQPSVNEGWSTSVEEAKAVGKLLLLSDIGVHLEQNPGNPYFFSSLDAGDLAGKIEKLWKETEGKSFPDLAAEQQAYDAYQEKVKAFGKRFLEIARY